MAIYWKITALCSMSGLKKTSEVLNVKRISYLVTHYKYSVLIVVLMLVSGCARNFDGTWKAPLVYRVDIQQGNVVDQTMISKLKPGMDQNQVRFLMGTPLLIDPFHTDRWEYIYSFEPGSGQREQRHITLFFKDEKLAYVKGDIEVTNTPIATEEGSGEKTVVVPLEEHKEGFFSRMWNKITPVDNKETTEKSPGAAEATTEKSSEPAGEVAEEKSGPVENANEKTSTAGESSQPAGEEKAALVNEAPKPESANTAEKNSVSQTSTTEKPEKTSGNTDEDKQKKNLFRRFWDRMTADKRDSETTGEETEQDRQDAEMLKNAGGGF